MASKNQFVKFNNGVNFPALGFGTWGIKRETVTKVVSHAIDVGYRHIDCARVYMNEKEVGQAIGQKIKDGKIKREEIFITSKVWNTHHRKDLVIPAFKHSLTDLGLKYLDLYLIHWPMAYKDGDNLFPADANKKTLYSEADYTDTWKELEKCVNGGLIKSIGVSNFNSKQLERLISNAKIKPVANQVECHPYLTQKKLQEFCKTKEIILIAYSPLGSPARPWNKPGDPVVLENEKLKEIAKKHNKDVAQILLRYQIQRGNMAIPKSATPSRIESNFNIFDFKLDDAEMKAIDDLNKNIRLVALEGVKDHKDYPFNAEF